ncbi:hypothetical protein ACFST9_17455 [Hymenobacter monticola]|uniref:Uncharacterized protein n=1 Tax=Hymenobacter monticola TaxID=1705399 RepID=A0ABY4B3E8_9BACT|nr:hypothetical protein [Hymenobacter monticola]UOE32308.1 hypothetical protein MTP16_14325 [Hymenobacter monticola]
MRTCLWLFAFLLSTLGVAAQVRVVGSFLLGVRQPHENASLKQAVAYNRHVIEATIEAAIQAGRLPSNLAVWGPLRKAAWEKGWHLSLAQWDSTALHSLRTQGYYRGPFGHKSYVLYLKRAAAFYTLTLVNCGFGGCELGIESIWPLDSPDKAPALLKSETKRYLALLFEELACRNAMALSPKGQVYWKARLTMQDVSLKKCP